MKHFTKEQIQQIIEDYNADIPTKEIVAKRGISRAYLTTVLNKHNVPLRRPRKNKSVVGTKSCPNCKKKTDVSGARFCPFCGADIRTPNEMLTERLKKLIEYAWCLPESVRDEYIAALNESADKIKKM